MSKKAKRKDKHEDRMLVFLGFLITFTIISVIMILGYNNYLYGGSSKVDKEINYEDNLIIAANSFNDIYSECTIRSISYDPAGMENGIYSIWIEENINAYQYQGGVFEVENKDLSTLNKQTIFTEFSKRENNIIQSSRNLVCKYIDDSDIFENKDWLKKRIQSVPFYMYKDTTHPELLSVMDAPAVHMGIGIYCNEAYSNFFCEYMIVHELIHHLRYLTSGEFISNELYFSTALDEGIADVIASIMEPKLFENTEYASGYMDYHAPIYRYISVFDEDALKAYFYGYDEFFEKYGGKTFKTEHDAFVVVLCSYNINYNSPMICEGIFQRWEAQMRER